jgi:hypothetical protein
LEDELDQLALSVVGGEARNLPSEAQVAFDPFGQQVADLEFGPGQVNDVLLNVAERLRLQLDGGPDIWPDRRSDSQVRYRVGEFSAGDEKGGQLRSLFGGVLKVLVKVVEKEPDRPLTGSPALNKRLLSWSHARSLGAYRDLSWTQRDLRPYSRQNGSDESTLAESRLLRFLD